MENRKWMYDRYDQKKLKDDYYAGVETFVKFATSHVRLMDGNKIKCPCQRCRNCRFHLPDDVREHLYRHGFLPNYYQWTAHGEATRPHGVPSSDNDQNSMGNMRDLVDQLNPEQRMIFDAAGLSFVPPTWLNLNNDFDIPNELETDFQEYDDHRPPQESYPENLSGIKLEK